MNKNNSQKKIDKEGAKQEVASSLSCLKNGRKCIGCGEVFERDSLIRVLKNHETNEYIINPSSKVFGRSFYICKNENCFKLAIKKKRFQKILKNSFNEEFLADLKAKI